MGNELQKDGSYFRQGNALNSRNQCFLHFINECKEKFGEKTVAFVNEKDSGHATRTTYCYKKVDCEGCKASGTGTCGTANPWRGSADPCPEDSEFSCVAKSALEKKQYFGISVGECQAKCVHRATKREDAARCEKKNAGSDDCIGAGCQTVTEENGKMIRAEIIHYEKKWKASDHKCCVDYAKRETKVDGTKQRVIRETKSNCKNPKGGEVIKYGAK